jgi:hypothetical protein
VINLGKEEQERTSIKCGKSGMVLFVDNPSDEDDW